jgi:hypothetical protein
MEKIAEFTDNEGFTVSLTSEKIFISAIGQEETFALRSVSGVGLFDDIAKYNRDLEEFKKLTNNQAPYVIIAIGVLCFILGMNGEGADLVVMPILGLVLVVIGLLIRLGLKKKRPPVLDSYFTLMLSGGDRRFKFSKSEGNSRDIANFINKVEDTLTAYVSK